MSTASSDTGVDSALPKVVAVFLAQFDMKLGYKLVWSSLPHDADLEGIESRALPSGIHEYSSTSIYLTHELKGELHYGLARFRQVDLNPEGASAAANDRLLVKMYSLGVLVEPLKASFWPPLQYLSIGWEYSRTIDKTLLEFLNKEDFSLLRKLTNSLAGNFDASSLLPSYEYHPLSKLPAVLSLVGPLIFPLYKAAILRKRILIFASSSQANGRLLTELTSNRDPGTADALAYIISLLALFPREVNLDIPNDTSLKTSKPLYSLGLPDLSSKFYEKYPGYVATTGDEIIKIQNNVYDIGLQFPPNDSVPCDLFSSNNTNTMIKCTYNDYTKFLKLYQKLPHIGSSNSAASDDNSSIKTSTSIFSALGLGYFFESKDSKLLWEPQWWLSDATSPMPWWECVWLAFAWFASAGATTREAETIDLETDGRLEEDVRNLLIRLTSIVSQFHQLTKKWFYVIDEIVSELVDYDLSDSQGKSILELTHQDVVDLELDPYSLQDLEFLREFVLVYWGSIVSDVEIGLGIQRFC